METGVKIIRSPKLPTVTRILVVEEYGYRHWWWDHPGSIEEVVKDWEAGRGPTNFFDPSEGAYAGTMTEIQTEEDLDAAYEFDKTAKVRAHVHENTDTEMTVRHDDGTVTHHYPPGYKTYEQARQEEEERIAKNASDREEIVKSIPPEDLLIYAMAYIDSLELNGGFNQFVLEGGKQFIPSRLITLTAPETLTCETCGHECGEDCTNCDGMKPGDAVCSVCKRGES